MKKTLLIFITVILGLNQLFAQDPWINNVMGGFENNTFNTQSNGLHIFNNQLYSAVGPDSGFVYRTATGQKNSWQKVFALPGVTSVNAVNSTSGTIYVSGYYGYNNNIAFNPDSTVIYRSADGATNWSPYFQFLGTARFIIPFKGSGTVDSMYVVKNGTNGSEIWKSAFDSNDPSNASNAWTQTLSFAGNGSYTITSNCIHNANLYIGTNIGTMSVPTLWNSSDGNNWTQLVTTVFDTTNSISAMASFGGYLYVGTENYNAAQIWKTNDNTTWTLVGHYPNNSKVTSLEVVSGELWATLQGKYMGEGSAIIKNVAVQPYNYSMANGFGIQDEKGANGLATEFGNNVYYACDYSFMARAQMSVANGNQIWKLCLTTPPPIDLGPDITVCEGISHTFDAGAASGYVWCDNSTNQTVTNSYPQLYFVTILGANGCENSDSVFLKNIPSPSISGNYLELFPLCKTDSLSLTVSATTNLRETLPAINQALTTPLTIVDYLSSYDTLLVSGITHDDGAGNTLFSVTIDSLYHPNNYELALTLISPGGSAITLSNYGNGSNYIGTKFTPNATTPFYNGTAPYTGSYNSIDPFYYLNGLTNGKWVLQITDNYGGNQGILKGWSLQFSQPDTLVSFFISPAAGLSSTNSTSFFAYPTASTVYTVTATNATNGCVSYDSIRIEVPDIKINSHAAHICSGYSDSISAEIIGLIQFQQTNYFNHHWSSNAGLVDSIAHGITVTPNSTTTYYVVDTIYNCPMKDSTIVNVSPLMTVDGGSPQTICLNDTATLVATVISGGTSPFTYTWDDGTLHPGQTYLTSPASGTSYTLTVTDDWGCIAGGSTSVSVNPLPIISTSASANTICYGDSVTLFGSGAITYTWDNGVTDNSSFVPANTTTYHVSGTDGNGCQDTSSIAVIVNSLPVVVANTTANTVCYQSAVTLTGSGALSYTWDNGVSDGIPFTPSTINSYTVIGEDANGCADTASIILTLNPQLFITANSNSNTICYSDTTTLTTNVSGGTPAYTYSWNDGTNTYLNATTIVSPLVNVSYTLTATDALGCTINDTVNVSVTPSTDIYGHIDSAGLSNVTDGAVVIYKYLPYQTHFDTIQVVSLDANGNYHFATINFGSYLIKVFPNVLTYPTAVPTYFGNQFLWTDATIINHDCGLNDTSNISVIFPQGTPAGPGALGGLIREGLGFIRQEGDPIPGLDVKLGKNPGGQIIASTETDANGYYYFENLSFNSVGESYIVYADIPGLGRDSSYTIVLDAAHPSYDSLNYLVDSSTIYIVPTSSTGINTSLSSTTSHFSVYPNPCKGNTTVEYSISTDADVTIELQTVLGTKIKTLVNSRQSAGNHKCVLNNQNNYLSSGIYFIRLTIAEQSITQRIVVIE